MNPTGYFVGAGVCALIACWLCLAAANPKVMESWRWGEDGDGPRLSKFGAIAWAMYAFSWAVGLLGAGLRWAFVEAHTGMFIFSGFGLIAVAACYDGIIRKKGPNKALVPTTTAVTPRAGHEPRQP
jgi:hypothetical protein